MLELWNKFMDWYNSLNLDVILDWIIVVAIPFIIGILKSKETKSLVKEVKVVAENKKNEKAVNGLTDEVSALKETNVKNNEEIQEELKKLTMFMFILLKNAKISEKDKATIIQAYNSKKTEVVKEVVVNPQEMLENIVSEVEEDIKNVEQKPTKIDELVKELITK